LDEIDPFESSYLNVLGEIPGLLTEQNRLGIMISTTAGSLGNCRIRSD